MEKEGIRNWGERDWAAGHKAEIDPDDKRFLEGALVQPWAPTDGMAVEFGCGTGPLIRWICSRGFRGLGVDVSSTAIKMAGQLSTGIDVRFTEADVCAAPVAEPGTVALCVDGFCLHCIIEDTDRQAYLKNAHTILADGGLLIILSMCSPTHPRFSSMLHGQRIWREIIYASSQNAGEYEGSHEFDGVTHMATRRVPHWKAILSEVRNAGFNVVMHRFNRYWGGEPCSSIALAALKKS